MFVRIPEKDLSYTPAMTTGKWVRIPVGMDAISIEFHVRLLPHRHMYLPSRRSEVLAVIGRGFHQSCSVMDHLSPYFSSVLALPCSQLFFSAPRIFRNYFPLSLRVAISLWVQLLKGNGKQFFNKQLVSTRNGAKLIL